MLDSPAEPLPRHHHHLRRRPKRPGPEPSHRRPRPPPPPPQLLRAGRNGADPPSPAGRSFAAVAAVAPSGDWTVAQNKRAAKAQKKKATPPPAMDQRSFELINEGCKLNRPEAEDIISLVNRALHKEGVRNVRFDKLRCSDAGRLLGVTTPTSTLQDLLEHQDTVLRAARVRNSSISDVVPQQKWKWVRIHNVPLDRYMGRVGGGGLLKLREELEAENSGVRIPAEVRWLGTVPRRGVPSEKRPPVPTRGGEMCQLRGTP